MTKADFISKVLKVLNEADSSISGATLIGADATNVSLFIEKLYPAAWQRAVHLFPRSWFTPKSISTNPVVDAPDGTGYVILPDDYVLLVSFKMRGWKENCTTAPDETPAINRKQANEYLRGTAQRPVCVIRQITDNNTVKRALYYYSLPKTADATTHVVEQALYIGNVSSMGNTIDIRDNGIDALAYLTAGMVLASMEKWDHAKAIESKIAEMIIQ